MLTDIFDSQLQYLDYVIATHNDELPPILKTFLGSLLSFAKAQRNFVLKKPALVKAIEDSSGAISDANFRKRVSQLNLIFGDEETEVGVKFDNNKAALSIIFDDAIVSNFIDQQTVDTIRRVNESGAPDTAHIVESTASDVMGGSRQVMFSYCWDTRESLLNRKREFAGLLEEKLRKPPAEYKNDPKIQLFLDVTGFEVGENQQIQQDTACEQSGVVVVPYCDGYIHSSPCQREISFFLTKEGDNHNGKKAIIAPFSTDIGNADPRYLKNLAAVPAKYATVLELLESGSESEILTFIDKLVHSIYKHFRASNTPPILSQEDKTSRCLIDAAKQQKDLPNTEDPLAAQGSRVSHEHGIKIVPYLKAWALNASPDITRLFYLLGDFGAGKSTTCQLLTSELSKAYDEAKQAGEEAVLPIYLDLKKLLNAFNNMGESLNAPVEKLLETMLSITGANQVEGEKIIEFVHKQPTLLIFDGFDEVGQKLTENQQIGLLNKIVGIFPDSVYQQDLQRLKGIEVEAKSNVPLQSRLLITCRTHFFSSMEKETAFRHLYYRHDAGEQAGDVSNFQTYYLLPFSKEQIKNYLVNWLGEDEGKKAVEFIERVHDLSGLSERPVMLQFIRQLIPDLMREAEHNANINAATLYKKLFQRAMTRDAEKHWIDTSEKFQLLARFAVHMWQQKTNELNQELLVDWFKQNYSQFTQIKIDIEQGKAGITELLQDLFNACLLVRDEQDNYRFAHTSFYEFFLACGLFDLVRLAPTTWQQGFDLFTAGAFVDEALTLNHETKQFLIDWRLTSSPQHVKLFDKQWQTLLQQKCTHDNKQIAFDLWYLAYRSQQSFTEPKSPNWSGINLQGVDFEYPLDLSGADLRDCLISQSIWRQVGFSNAQFSGARLMQVHFDNCSFASLQSVPESVQLSRFWQCSAEGELCADSVNKLKQNYSMPKAGDTTCEEGRLELSMSVGPINAACYSPDGATLALSNNEGAIFIYSLEHRTMRRLDRKSVV